jgi:DAK2 domain fusion protein YloV
VTGAASVDGPSAVDLITAAARSLKDHRDEVNRLNVFPVPDGDTGTNMSLTMDAVLTEVGKLPPHPSMADVCQAVTHGSLMGARGNSGVILSQMLRGVCEGLAPTDHVDAQVVTEALARSVTVAFQAVRRPVEGTMLTVLRDAAEAATPPAESGAGITTVLETAVEAAFASVRRTPDLLPVLKEAGVVDAGGYGLAILAEGFIAGLAGHEIRSFDVTVTTPAAIEELAPANDWDDTEHLYCTEFLLFGHDIDRAAVEDFMASIGGSVLAVGSANELKVHVHTDTPAKALEYALGLGEVAEVHVNNMRRQTAARKQALLAEPADLKPIGFVAVAAGQGLVDILKSLGADVVVSGGQTMNPSTAELLEAIDSVPAKSVVILPDNRNIILAANQTVGIATKPVLVVPTTSVPQAFSALLAADPDLSEDENVAAMTEAAEAVRTGEITTAIKDSKGKVGPIKAGQIIGIAEHEIEAVGSDLGEVARHLLDAIIEDGETLTLLAGADLSDADLASIAAVLSADHPELEVETHRGDQPLYPLLMAVE